MLTLNNKNLVSEVRYISNDLSIEPFFKNKDDFIHNFNFEKAIKHNGIEVAIEEKKISDNYWEYCFKVSEDMKLHTRALLIFCFIYFWKVSIPNLLKNKDLNEDVYIRSHYKCYTKFSVKSYCALQILNTSDMKEAWNTFESYYLLKQGERYTDDLFGWVFTVSFVEKDSKELTLEKKSKFIPSKHIKHLKRIARESVNYKGFNIPITQDLSKWGDMTVNSEKNKFFIGKFASRFDFNILIKGNERICSLLDNDKIRLEFVDTIIDKNFFLRKMGLMSFYYLNEKEVLKTKLLKSNKYINKTNRYLELNLKDNYMTLDIETKIINNVMVPTTICFYDGKDVNSFFIGDKDEWIKNPDSMILHVLSLMFIRKYAGYHIYVHNLSFDATFLIRQLSKLTNKVKPLSLDNSIFMISVTFGRYKFYFKDSYRMFPYSLKKLSRLSNNMQKDNFPHEFINQPDIGYDYIGKVPEFKYFTGMSLDEYNQYKFKHQKWSYRDESISYCNKDVIALYDILGEFNLFIFEKYGMNMHLCPTLPSLALALYRTKFIQNDWKVPCLNTIQYLEISESYKGGSVDVYEYYAKNVYRYDVNSLYPYVMKQFLMPIGDLLYFEGDILEQIDHIDPKYQVSQSLDSLQDNNVKLNIRNRRPFGFFEVEVTAPSTLNIPILLTVKDGINIAPVGKWKGMYFSEELFNAQAYGYKFKILRGYLSEHKNIFNDYIDSVYEIKKNSAKDSVGYTVGKLLMNSLYGKFGMSPFKSKIDIIEAKDLNYYNYKNTIEDIIPFDGDKFWIKYFEHLKYAPDNLDKKGNVYNINVGIASAITSYARIVMSDLKLGLLNKGYKVYYSDTDNLDINKPLPDYLVSPTVLGKLKFENFYKEMVYVAPKVYAGLTEKGEYVKIKGSKINASFNDLKLLLNESKHLKLEQDRWIKDLDKGRVNVLKILYTLMLTKNKREIIYSNKGDIIGTKPFLLDDTNTPSDKI